MKKLILTLATLCSLASIAVFTTGCNTMEGAGKDIERAGEKSKAVHRNTNKHPWRFGSRPRIVAAFYGPNAWWP
ncbi:MAG: entericidin A/B family lipoprotein [Betaproteobacteria bacterium]|nr:entericidin A/B family lipoprotein [Betaproteobacteria bacterium]